MGNHFLVLRDEVAGQSQGAVVPLVGDFRSGVHRGKFNPIDGQLYVSGLAGWGSYTPDDGCFERVRFTGEPVQLPCSFHVHQNSVIIGFTQPGSPEQVKDLSQQFAQTWNYRYGPAYGSQEFAPSHPGVVGHEVLSIEGIHVIDADTIFVEMPDIQPVNQLHFLLRVDAGRPQELFVTAHQLDKPFSKFEGYQPTEKTVAAHPLAVDLALLGRSIPNRWTTARPDSVPLAISAGKNLTFSTRTLKAKRGQEIQLTFDNPDVVPHNWVLVRPGSLQRVGELSNKFVADPVALLHQCVPKSRDVLVYTDIVDPSKQFTIYFRAPKRPGRYPYLCTFPGHWMVMNGELIVE
jgi:azurin